MLALSNAFGWSWAGLQHKTLWDWLVLLSLPVVVAGAALWLTAHQRQTARVTSRDHEQEVTLETTLAWLTTLVCPAPGPGLAERPQQEQQVARARTLAALQRLNGERKGILVQFLYDAALLDHTHPVVNLRGADLSGANLHQADLHGAQLSGADLRGADLQEANLEEADLQQAHLCSAKLSGTSLHWASLRWADLSKADLREADLREADLSLTNLGRTHLDRADLHQAHLRDAFLEEASLKDARVTKEQLAQTRWLDGATLPLG